MPERTPQADAAAAVLEFECPACGGGLEFTPSSQTVRCPYCDTELSVEALEELANSAKTVDAAEASWEAPTGSAWQEGEQLNSYICNSCGGELLCDANTAATHCPYCDNPVVLTGRVSGTLRPDLIIPFKLDKQAAKAALQRHMSGKILIPKQFKSENQLEKLQGIYVPFWLFDSEAEAEMHYRATRVRTWMDSEYSYVHTSHYSLYRAGVLKFTGVPVDGSAKFPDELMESLEPYDLSQAEQFQMAYLAGYLADKYDVSSTQTQARANQRMEQSTQQVFRETAHGYQSVTPQSTNIHLKNSRVRYGLLPVWMLTTRYRGKTYTFAMNGQTGKMVGDLPTDTGAAWGWFALLSPIATAAAYLLGMLMNG